MQSDHPLHPLECSPYPVTPQEPQSWQLWKKTFQCQTTRGVLLFSSFFIMIGEKNKEIGSKRGDRCWVISVFGDFLIIDLWAFVLRSQLFVRLLWVTSLCQNCSMLWFRGCLSYSCNGNPSSFVYFMCIRVHAAMRVFPDVCAMVGYRS